MMKLYAGIEAGGTKFNCAIGTISVTGDIAIQQKVSIPTTTPKDTFAEVTQFFEPYQEKLIALGIGSFGPVDLNPHSPSYGYITSTPKPSWANTSFAKSFASELAIPVGFDTDVNVAALGEKAYGAGKNYSDFIYMTFGTGIGGGVVSNDQLIHGLVHTELGHICIPKHSSDSYEGSCPYHGDQCFEGLASGVALEERWGIPAIELEENHPAWELQSHYIALALTNYICMFSPKRIILGGGVSKQGHLFPKIRAKVQAKLNGYIQHASINESIDEYIVPPLLGDDSGIIGALVLAKNTKK